MPPPERAPLDANTLNVFYAEHLIGRLRFDAKEQLYSFEYDEGWQNDPAAFDLAPLLPKKERTHAGTAVRFFFSNLLPEGEMLEIVSRTYGVSKYDPFGLLRKIGGTPKCHAKDATLVKGDSRINAAGWWRAANCDTTPVPRERPW